MVARSRTLGEISCDDCRRGDGIAEEPPSCSLGIYDMKDYWRFTPRGLRTLLERSGIEVEEVGSWGNRDCVVGNFDKWPAFRWWHSLRNEPDLPVQVWAFARRPD